MIARGVLLLLSYTDVPSASWHTVTLQVLRLFVYIVDESKSNVVQLVVAYQPKIVLVDLITQLQDLLTNMMIFSGGRQLYVDLFEAAIRTLGFIRAANLKYRPEGI